MKDKKNIPLVICIILISINAFLAFDLFGMLNNSESHFEIWYVESWSYLRLEEDVIGVTEDGRERLFTAGSLVSNVVRYDPEDNSPVISLPTPVGEYDVAGDPHTEYTLRGAVYEDVTEEVRQEIERKNAEAPKLASKLSREYDFKRYTWFFHQGEEITDIAGHHLCNIHGSYIIGLIAAGIVIYFDVIYLSRCRKKGKTGSFIACNIILFGALLMFGAFRLIFPLCR